MSFLNFIQGLNIVGSEGKAPVSGAELFNQVIAGTHVRKELNEWMTADITDTRGDPTKVLKMLQAVYLPNMRIPTYLGDFTFSLHKGLVRNSDGFESDIGDVSGEFYKWLRSGSNNGRPSHVPLLDIMQRTRDPQMTHFVIGCGDKFIQTPFSTTFQSVKEIAEIALNAYLKYLRVFMKFNTAADVLDTGRIVQLFTYGALSWNGDCYELIGPTRSNYSHFIYKCENINPNFSKEMYKVLVDSNIINNIIQFEIDFTHQLLKQIKKEL